MRIVRFKTIAFGLLMVLASCHSTQKVTLVPSVTPQVQQMVVATGPASDSFQTPASAPLQREKPVQKNYDAPPAMLGFASNNNLQEEKVDKIENPVPAETSSNSFTEMSASVNNKQAENIQSFAQVKQMVAEKQLNLSKKQLKRLDKLDSKYHGDFNKFKKDAGNVFDTQTSKIIGAVGVVGLLLLIISGSGFGAFILILSVGALLLKWLGIISF